MNIGIIGFGSIGKRHSKNLLELGANVSILRSTNKKTEKDSQESSSFYFDEDDFFSNNLDGIVICNPTFLHKKFIELAVAKDLNFFCEKPLASNASDLEHLSKSITKKNLTTCCGYMMRYHKEINLIKEIIDSGQLGRITSSHINWSTYLPDWHPWEDYSESYASNSEMGGGAILTCSHEIDTMNYLFGKSELQASSFGSSDQLSTNTDDYFDAFFITEDGISVQLHVDWFSKIGNRTIRIIGDKGQLDWNFFKNRIYLKVGSKKSVLEDEYEINNCYLDNMRDFLNCINKKIQCRSNYFNGLETLKICNKIMDS